MQTCFYLLFFFHISEGCTLSNYKEDHLIASSGGSVELPCSCIDRKDKASSLIWLYRKKENVIFDQIYPTDKTNRYKGRVQLVNGAAPGNFNIVISRLTVEDGGTYECQDENQSSNLRLVFLTVEAPLVLSKTTASTPEQNGGSKTSASTPSPGISSPTGSGTEKNWNLTEHLYVLCPVLLVLLLLLGGVLYWTCRAPRQGKTRNEELQTGQDSTELLYLAVTFKPARKPPQVHSNDEDVLYTSVNVRSDNEQDDDVMYATVNKSRAQISRQTAGD